MTNGKPVETVCIGHASLIGRLHTDEGRDGGAIVGGAEHRIDLRHFSKSFAGGGFAKIYGNLADLKVERDSVDFGVFPCCGFAVHQTIAEHHGRSERGVAAEGNFLLSDEDAHFDSSFELDGGIARKNKSGFFKVGFASDVLHLSVGEPSGVGENGELVTLEAMRGEDVDLDETEVPGIGR
jgi:hypothetical protein